MLFRSQAGTSLADYIKSKNYLLFTTAPSSTDGFWVNVSTGIPTVTSPVAALDTAKAFMDTMRSNLKALGAADISLQTELQDTADDLKSRLAPLASNNINSLRTIHDAVIFWNDVVKNPNSPFASTLYLYSKANYYPGMPPSGACTLYLDPNYTSEALAKDEAKYIACGISDYFIDTIPATDANGVLKNCTNPGDWCQTQWSARIRINPDPSDINKFGVYTQTRESVYTQPALAGLPYIETRTNYGAPFPGNASTLITTRDSSGNINGVNLQGELSPGYQVTTNWSGYYDTALNWIVKPNAIATLYGDKHNVVFNGALTHPNDGIDKYSFSGSSELIKNGLSDTHFSLLDGSYVLASSSSVATAQGAQTVVQDGSHEIVLKISGGSAESQISGNLKLGSFSTDFSHTHYQPTLFSFAGEIGRNGNSFFGGSIVAESQNYANFDETLPASNLNYMKIHTSFTGSINIPTRLPLLVNMVSNQVKAGESTASSLDISGQYTQGTLIINLSAYNKLNVRMMTLQSTDGVELTVDQTKTIYPITFNSVLEGVYDTTTGKIDYVDGTYTIY